MARPGHRAGSYGRPGPTGRVSTAGAVTGTAAPEPYRSARRGAHEYRFDGPPDGFHRVDAGAAGAPGERAEPARQ
ncbi:hypothetical protein ABT096_34705 [Streptomyces sp. NPDC002561]|uniref:hypothetical protein n=1 Tax=Streptomyces sp. NPDC002561 TaxID=3154418 RepID=UPI00331DB9BD